MTRKYIKSRRSVTPRSPSRRRRWIWKLGIPVLISSVGVVVLIWSSSPRSSLASSEEPTSPVLKSPWPANLPPEQQLDLLMKAELQLGEDLIKALPNHEDPYIIMGNIYSRRGNTDQARQMWQQALSLNPQRPEVYNSLADLAQQTDQLERAVELWQKVLEVAPRTPGIHLKMAEALSKSGQFEACIQQANAEIQLTGPAADPYYQIGLAYQYLKDYAKAQQNYTRCIQLDPGHINGYYGLYSACMHLGQTDAAQRAMQTYQTLKVRHDTQSSNDGDSDLDCSFISLAQFYTDVHWVQQRYQGSALTQTQVIMNKAISLGLDNAAFLKRIAPFLAQQKQPAQALELTRRLAQLEPSNVSCPLSIGTLAMQLGRYDQAEQAFRQAVAMAPDRDTGYRLLARLFLKTKRNLPEAYDLARKAVSLNPQALAYFELGIISLAAGHREEGLQALEEAVNRSPDNKLFKETYTKAKHQ